MGVEGNANHARVCSYREEANADAAIKALTSALAPKAKVIRDGKAEAIDATGLVPGALYPLFTYSILTSLQLFTSSCPAICSSQLAFDQRVLSKALQLLRSVLTLVPYLEPIRLASR